MKNGKQAGPLLPQMSLYDEDYATLCHRLDVYDDQVIYTRFRQSQPEATFPVDPADLASILGGFPLSTGMLPRDCLFWNRQGGETKLAIYIEPQVWQVSVKGEKHPWRVPQPGLVMVGWGARYGLHAVKERPFGARTLLYKAPCPNVHGNVCRGNVPFPPASSETIWQAVELFFSSGFNADLSGGKSMKHSNILDMWRELHEAKAEVYPLDDLVPEGFTLMKLMESA